MTCNHKVISTPEGEKVCSLCGVVLGYDMVYHASRRIISDKRFDQLGHGGMNYSTACYYSLGTDRGWYNTDNYMYAVKRVYQIVGMYIYNQHNMLVELDKQTYASLTASYVLWHYIRFKKLKKRYNRYNQLILSRKRIYYLTFMMLKSIFSKEFLLKKHGILLKGNEVQRDFAKKVQKELYSVLHVSVPSKHKSYKLKRQFNWLFSH